MPLEKEKTNSYKEAESKLISEINEYVESCIKGLDLNKDFNDDDERMLSKISSFSENMVRMHKKNSKTIKR